MCFDDGGLFQYHPADKRHHGGVYYKISTGKGEPNDMNSTVQKNSIKNRLEQLLSDQFEMLSLNGAQCFQKKDGTVFMISAFPDEDAIVVEYADSFSDAKLNRFEDGDRFYLGEISIEALFQQVLREINQP